MKVIDALNEVIWHKILRTQTPKERALANINWAVMKAPSKQGGDSVWENYKKE